MDKPTECYHEAVYCQCYVAKALIEKAKEIAVKDELIKHYERDAIPLLEAKLKERESEIERLRSERNSFEGSFNSAVDKWRSAEALCAELAGALEYVAKYFDGWSNEKVRSALKSYNEKMGAK